MAGWTVRSGSLFRADALHRVPPEDSDSLAALGWRTVIDLRTAREREGGICRLDVPTVVHLPMLKETWSDIADADVGDAVDFLATRYIEMAEEGAGAIAAAIELMSYPERLPAVFHCTAGKDRTGVLAAVVLAVLGVPDEVIAADYELSAAAIEKLVVWVRTNQPAAAEQLSRQPAAFLACPPEAILRFLEGLRTRHGSVDGYLASIGIRRHTIGALRDLLLV